MKKILLNLFFKKFTRPRLEEFLEKYTTQKYTLNLGGGAGLYKKYFPNSVCLDIKKREGVDVVGDAHNIPFSDNIFDIVLCTNMLGDCERPYQVASEVERVLKPRGLVILNAPFFFPINDIPNDYWRFTPYSLEKMFKNFNKKELTPMFGQMETISILFQRLAYQSKGSRFKRLIFAIISTVLFRLNLDKFIVQAGYDDISRKNEVDCFFTAMYFGVFEKKASISKF
jgi:ubiquinone/menaquinone biosynthesis C-methylase UbiE